MSRGEPLEAYIYWIQYHKYSPGAERAESHPFHKHEFKSTEPMPPIPPVGSGFMCAMEGQPQVNGTVRSVDIKYMSGAEERIMCWYEVVIDEDPKGE